MRVAAQVLVESIERVERAKQDSQQSGSGDAKGVSAEEVAEARRANMRNALARYCTVQNTWNTTTVLCTAI